MWLVNDQDDGYSSQPAAAAAVAKPSGVAGVRASLRRSRPTRPWARAGSGNLTVEVGDHRDEAGPETLVRHA